MHVLSSRTKIPYFSPLFYDNPRVRPIIGASRKGKSTPIKPILQMINAGLFYVMNLLEHKGMQVPTINNYQLS
jgi:hypothetical protein